MFMMRRVFRKRSHTYVLINYSAQINHDTNFSQKKITGVRGKVLIEDVKGMLNLFYGAA